MKSRLLKLHLCMQKCLDLTHYGDVEILAIEAGDQKIENLARQAKQRKSKYVKEMGTCCGNSKFLRSLYFLHCKVKRLIKQRGKLWKE